MHYGGRGEALLVHSGYILDVQIWLNCGWSATSAKLSTDKTMLKTLARLLAIGAIAAPLAAQAVTFQFNANLNSAQEVSSNAATATGLAVLFYNDGNTVVTFDDSYSFSLFASGLSGAITGAHIHAPGLVGANGPVVVPLNVTPFTFSNAGGSLLIGGAGVAPPSALFLSQLQGGQAYVNLHTAIRPGGEIRGQLFQVAVVPEPETYAMLLAGLGLIGWIGARRRNRT